MFVGVQEYVRLFVCVSVSVCLRACVRPNLSHFIFFSLSLVVLDK